MAHLTFQNNFSGRASVDELHAETRNWQSEIDFWKAEGKFFQTLVRKQLAGPNVEMPKATTPLTVRIDAFRKETLPQLQDKLNEHRTRLEGLIKKKLTEEEQSIRKTHRELDRRMDEVKSHFRILKQSIFETVERSV